MEGVSLSLITTFFFNKSKISPVRIHQDTMVTIAIEMLDLERSKVISILFPATCVQQPKQIYAGQKTEREHLSQLSCPFCSRT